MDRAHKKAARAALDGFQGELLTSRTLNGLAEARVRFAEQLAAALPLSDADRVELVNALLGREDATKPAPSPGKPKGPSLADCRDGVSGRPVRVG